MRFNDLFSVYILEMRKQNEGWTTTWKRIPSNLKIAFASMVLCVAGLEIAAIIRDTNLLKMFSAFLIISILIFVKLTFNETKTEKYVYEMQIPNSQKRMETLISVLKKFDIDVNDEIKVDLIISEAEKAQRKSDIFLEFKRPIKLLGTMLLPIVAYGAHQIGSAVNGLEAIKLAIVCVILAVVGFVTVTALGLIAKDVLYKEYNQYEAFIYDLRQIKIFYNKARFSVK